MLYAKINDNNVIVEYPYDINSLRKEHPNVSFPDEMTPESLYKYSIVEVVDDDYPDLSSYKIVDIADPVFKNGKWVKQWVLEPIDNSEQVRFNDKKADVLIRRDMLLVECDWTQLKDVPEETSSKWTEYRRLLRDITTQEGFPFNIEWPRKPN